MNGNVAFDLEMLKERPRARYIIGLDEAGRGPLAGPLSVGLFLQWEDAVFVEGVGDSKKLSPKKRQALFARLKREPGTLWRVVLISPREVDRLNILEATRRGMASLISSLPAGVLAKSVILTDAVKPGLPGITVREVIRGDALSYVVGCASIAAKVIRDDYMDTVALRYPGFCFEQNKGYPTRHHQEMLRALGPTPIHRKSYRPVKEALTAQIKEVFISGLNKEGKR
jgi:ribonuclease HII